VLLHHHSQAFPFPYSAAPARIYYDQAHYSGSRSPCCKRAWVRWATLLDAWHKRWGSIEGVAVICEYEIAVAAREGNLTRQSSRLPPGRCGPDGRTPFNYVEKNSDSVTVLRIFLSVIPGPRMLEENVALFARTSSRNRTQCSSSKHGQRCMYEYDTITHASLLVHSLDEYIVSRDLRRLSTRSRNTPMVRRRSAQSH
jgi:hypothetical protein